MSENLCKDCGEFPIATHLNKSYCIGCYNRRNDAAKTKQSESATKRHEREKAAKELEIALRVDEAEELIMPKDFNLAEQYEDYKALNLAGDGEYYNEKFAYAAWLNADARSRTPETKSDVAKILGVSVSGLDKWSRSGAFKKISKRVLDHWMRYRVYRLYLRQMTTGLARGNKDAVNSYEKLFVFPEDKELKNEDDIPDEDVDEASKIVKEKGLSVDISPNHAGVSRKSNIENITDRLVSNS